MKYWQIQRSQWAIQVGWVGQFTRIHPTCVGAEVKVGGVGARHTVALPLLVGRRRCRLWTSFVFHREMFRETWLKWSGHLEDAGSSHLPRSSPSCWALEEQIFQSEVFWTLGSDFGRWRLWEFFVSYRWSHVPTSFSIAAEIPPKSEQPKWLVGISCWEMLDYSYFHSLDTTRFHFPAW